LRIRKVLPTRRRPYSAKNSGSFPRKILPRTTCSCDLPTSFCTPSPFQKRPKGGLWS
jgi:hypothetical protein